MGCCGGRKIAGGAGRAAAVPPQRQAVLADGGRELLRRPPAAEPEKNRAQPAALPRPAAGKTLPGRGRARGELGRQAGGMAAR